MVAAFLAVIAQVLQTGLAALAATSTEASRGLCSRNGVSRPDGCLCDAAWTGPDCSQLALLPAPGATSSWGGTVTWGEDGQYHLLVSEMLGSCGLGAWQHNSIIRHATSSEIDGVYQHTSDGGSYGRHWSETSGPLVTPVMHRFDGKAEWSNATMTCAPDAAGSTACVWSNPSGWVDSDGTAWINYVLRGEHNTTGRGGYGFGLAKAPHWSGPYSPVAAPGQEPYWDAPVLPSARTPQQNCEDSTLYRDRRGFLHMLFHYFGLADDHGDHGGHAHAHANGTGWQFSEGHAWNLTMHFEDGEPAAHYGYRQRPHIVLSPAGELTHLITGVVWDGSRPYPAECSKCTGTRGPCDRAWTVMQPLRTAMDAK